MGRRGGSSQKMRWEAMADLGCTTYLRTSCVWHLPQAIGPSIKIMYETLYGEKTEEEPPSVNFIRQCRVVVEIMGETVTALKLASADSWKQLWTDATTRRQIPFTALIIGLLGDEEDIDPVIVSSCIFMDDERSETQADGIVDKVSFELAPFCLVQKFSNTYHSVR